ncbi:histidine kinase [Saccharopolyspora erythraea NRRL 2338]|uniref:histidine kinase n=2 Tax=Saccharopolyspora erythraea TaxID=1836 RepID=A4FEW0_SACEN|nr:ATP-binding protein [Saccharopolyspora erythraea]PFG96311.1 histidine kinase [Saccharopolyspora erythraea NRRL 2338]QRK92828.1 two-component sensor histidine kinase [Saccharopolyspora erythraea]CAM02585.1 putative signal transduction histidine kinase [Saccharopolyspora erythraea NRRL 2338]
MDERDPVAGAPSPAAAGAEAGAPAVRHRPVFGVYYTALVAYTGVTIAWLMIGAVAATAHYWPYFNWALQAVTQAPTAARWPVMWAQGFVTASAQSEPLGQAVLDYALSILNLVVAGALLWSSRSNWSTRLLVLALVGSAGAFNLQAHVAPKVVQAAFGVSIGWWHVLLLHGIGGVAYVLALLLFPTGRWDRAGTTSWLARIAVGVSIAGVLSLLALSTADYPHTVSFVVFFGILVPLVGLIAQRQQARQGTTPDARRQSRLLFATLTVAVGVVAVLALVSLWLLVLGAPGLTLFDPTARKPGEPFEEPSAVVFWPVRFVFAAVPCALIITAARTRPWDIERMFSHALAFTVVLVSVGSGYVVVSATLDALLGGTWGSVLSAVVAVLVVALAFVPMWSVAERMVDRLIYGTRPAPAAVLTQVADLSGATDHPDLAELAKVVARGLGAAYCRLTVRLPELGDRAYQWPDELGELAEPVTLPVHYGGEEVGVLTVDRTSVTSVPEERSRLLDDLVSLLGPVLHNSRLGIELEHQLHTALRHAEEIAASRRRATADMDSERRTLERNLHDGAQHHLVALRMTMGLAEHELTHGAAESARERLGQVIAQVNGTRKVLASTAAGVFPVVLADHGLLPALSAELAEAGSDVMIDIDESVGERRFPLAVETAVYFTCLEAVNNAFKHAPEATVRVRVRNEYRGLAFTVTDDGPGFDTARSEGAGRGLHNLADRANAVGGTVTVRSAPNEGTTVEGFIPL